MISSQIRANARESLSGKWGTVAILTLVFSLVTFVIAFILALIPIIGNIIWIAIEMPISYGFLVSLIKIKRNEEVGYTDFLSLGFSSFSKVWGVVGNIILKMIVPICLLIVFIIITQFALAGTIFTVFASSSLSAGLFVISILSLAGYIASSIYVAIKGLLYSMSFYIRYDNPNMTGKEVVQESENLMRGNRWKYVWLNLTFLGWAILSNFTFGIGLLWLIPYMMVSGIIFYEILSDRFNDTQIVDNNTTL